MIRRKDIRLEVTYDAERGAWIVRQLGGNPLLVFKVARTREEAEEVAGGIATFVMAKWNRSKRCEVVVRNLDGTWGDPSTYGYDSERFKG